MRHTPPHRSGYAVLIACVFCFNLTPAFAFRIVSPHEGQTVHAGEQLAVNIDAGQDPGIIQVRYYWYGEQDDTLVEQEHSSSTGAIVATAALVATATNEPPYGGELVVPPEGIGPMRLLAVGDISRGRLGIRSVFDEIVVQVEPKAELTSIEFETDKPLRLGRLGQSADYGHIDSMGKIFDLPVIGVFSDGVARSIRSPETGTVYRSSNEQVIKIYPQGLFQIVGNGRTTITVLNRGKHADLDVIVEVNDEPNEPPLADAGISRTVKSGSRVELSGLNSKDPEGEALFYSWSQIRGSKIALLDPNMPKASFIAPTVSEKRLFRFKLRVSDRKGAESLPAFVNIFVEP